MPGQQYFHSTSKQQSAAVAQSKYLAAFVAFRDYMALQMCYTPSSYCGVRTAGGPSLMATCLNKRPLTRCFSFWAMLLESLLSIFGAMVYCVLQPVVQLRGLHVRPLTTRETQAAADLQQQRTKIVTNVLPRS
jgi:hypothetical protein